MDKNIYTADSIESLEPLEFVRLRPNVYAGDTTYSTQLIVELFSNSLDEHNLGHGNLISINTEDNGWVEVLDEGQGFPVNQVRSDGKTVLEAAFSVLNTSGKYRDDGVYEGTSLGSYGLGAKLATFLSHKLIVTTWQNGTNYETLLFTEGELSLRQTGQFDTPRTPSSGTDVRFLPSEQFFTNVLPNKSELEKLFNDTCCLCPNLTVKFNGNYIHHPNGLSELLQQKVGEHGVTQALTVCKSSGKQKLDFGMQYSDAAGSIIAYVNYGLTDSGPHIVTVKSTITKVLNNWAREHGMLKVKDDNLDGPSLQEGMVVVFNLVSPGVTYDAQVKSRVTSNHFNTFINDSISESLTKWLDNNPDNGKKIVEKALLARKAAEAARKAREAVKNKASKKKEKVFQLPTKLTDCWTKDRSKAELLITEGLSAASGLVEARNGEFQAVYGVRGKMLSVLKTTPSKILQNQEINNLIQALGLDCDTKTAKLRYDPDDLRYGKIIACADAD